MDKKLTYTGSVTDTGEIKLPARFGVELSKYFAGKEIWIEVERKRKHRTLNQNAYYWAVVIKMISDAMNEAGEHVHPQEVHEFLKFRFLRVQKIDHDSGELLYEYSRSTASLGTADFGIYLDACIQFAAEYLNTVIPPPNTQTADYYFPEYQAKQESRSEFLERVWSYLEEITAPEHVVKYFNYCRIIFENDPEIKALFRKRHSELKAKRHERMDKTLEDAKKDRREQT